jgi:antagonist of KipI
MIAGAQVSWFPPRALTTTATGSPAEYFVTAASNRMGLRLEGPPLPVAQRELISEPVCPGAIQVTRDGQCIILGVDGQTIGGYPKIGQVISADQDELGQLKPGERLSFVEIALEDAEALFRQKQAELDHWILRMRTSLSGL